MKRAAPTLLASLLVFGCAASTQVRPPLLPWWLTSGAEVGEILHLRQDVTFPGEGVRICRTLTNRSSRELVINKLSVGGSNRGQVTSWRFHGDGNMIVRPVDGTHSPWQFPMIPAGPDDTSPYQVMGPGGQVEDCEMLDLSAGDVFQVVSRYSSDLDEAAIPRDFLRGRLAVSNGQFVLSGICLIRSQDRSAECTEERHWRVKASAQLRPD